MGIWPLVVLRALSSRKEEFAKTPLFNTEEGCLQRVQHTAGYPCCKWPIYGTVSIFYLQLRLAVILYMNKSFLINDYFLIFSQMRAAAAIHPPRPPENSCIHCTDHPPDEHSPLERLPLGGTFKSSPMGKAFQQGRDRERVEQQEETQVRIGKKNWTGTSA